MSSAPPSSGTSEHEPAPLSAVAARQAFAGIGGFVYQAWQTIDAWLQLTTADEVIYIEGAEDFDAVIRNSGTATQVKREAGTISLNTNFAQAALANYWGLVEREPNKKISFNYLTTRRSAQEQDEDFGGRHGIQAWRAAANDLAAANSVHQYLKKKFAPTTPFGAFLHSADADSFKAKVIDAFRWLVDQPGKPEVEEGVRDRIAVHLEANKAPIDRVQAVKDRLFATFWAKVDLPDPNLRKLTRGELIVQMHEAVAAGGTIQLSRDAKQDLVELAFGLQSSAQRATGTDVVVAARSSVPPIPSPLLDRSAVVNGVREKLAANPVILVGSVHMGKTTIAQLAALETAEQASWFGLSDFPPGQTDRLLRQLSAAIESCMEAHCVVLDDIDLAPAAHRVFAQSLDALVKVAQDRGLPLLITARGSVHTTISKESVAGVDVTEIPAMTAAEIDGHCRAHGCPESELLKRATHILVTTGGHPRLVQVLIRELAATSWPPLDYAALTSGQSQAVVYERRSAKSLLNDALKDPAAVEFVYSAAESTSTLTRAMLLELATDIGGIANPGDLIDRLMGTWLEPIGGTRFRVTPILKGAAGETWTLEKARQVHARIYDCMIVDGTMQAEDAPNLLLHAYLAQDPSRLYWVSRAISLIDNREASRLVHRLMVWLPFAATGPGQRLLTVDRNVSVLLRQLQFQTARELKTDLYALFDRWEEEVEALPTGEFRDAARTIFLTSLISTPEARPPLRRRMVAIQELQALSESSSPLADVSVRKAIEMSVESPGGLPATATGFQFHVFLQAHDIRSYETLADFLTWLEYDASPEQRAMVDDMLTWPAIRNAGAFVHAWAHGGETRTDWKPICDQLVQAAGLADRFNMPRFGREVAKARSIVTCEYLNQIEEAHRLLANAEQRFGSARVLEEQRSNCLFHEKKYQEVVSHWKALLLADDDPGSIEPFAYRRAAISAGKIGQFALAETWFTLGSQALPWLGLHTTSVSMAGDAAYAAILDGRFRQAAGMQARIFETLPPAAFMDGNPDWEEVIRAIGTHTMVLSSRAFGTKEVPHRPPLGAASEPALKANPGKEGQPLRTRLFGARVAECAGALGVISESCLAMVEPFATADFPALRLTTCNATMAYEFGMGPTEKFLGRLKSYGLAFSELLKEKMKSGAEERPVDPTSVDAEIAPLTWMPLLIAALALAPDRRGTLARWEAEIPVHWSNGAGLLQEVTIMRGILSGTSGTARRLLEDANAPPSSRASAALHVLDQGNAHPEQVFYMQQFLYHLATAGNTGTIASNLFSSALAKSYAEYWRAILLAPHLLQAPRISVPALTQVVIEIENGGATTTELLAVVRNCLGL